MDLVIFQEFSWDRGLNAKVVLLIARIIEVLILNLFPPNEAKNHLQFSQQKFAKIGLLVVKKIHVIVRFFLHLREANDLVDHLMISDHSRPLKPATSEESMIRCGPLRWHTFLLEGPYVLLG